MFIEFLLCGRHGAKGWAYRMIRISRVPGASLGFSNGSEGKNPSATQETQEMRVQSLGREDPPEEEIATHFSILAWENSHGQRSLAGESPWAQKESHITEFKTELKHKYEQGLPWSSSG